MDAVTGRYCLKQINRAEGGVSATVLFRSGRNALIHEAGAVFHLYLLLIRPLIALTHLLRLVTRHHLFRRGGLHRAWHLGCASEKRYCQSQRNKECHRTMSVHICRPRPTVRKNYREKTQRVQWPERCRVMSALALKAKFQNLKKVPAEIDN